MPANDFPNELDALVRTVVRTDNSGDVTITYDESDFPEPIRDALQKRKGPNVSFEVITDDELPYILEGVRSVRKYEIPNGYSVHVFKVTDLFRATSVEFGTGGVINATYRLPHRKFSS